MEENCICYGKTHFYVDLDEEKYGLRINFNDIDRKDELINRMHNDKSIQLTINAWRKEWGMEEILWD